MFFKTIEVTLTIRQTFSVSAEESESVYGVGLDALDDTIVRETEAAHDEVSFLGDFEVVDYKCVVSEIQQR
jgi:hypothetical protein